IVVFNIGPSGKIKGAVNIGATQETDNLALLKKELEPLPRETEVVIYCGCCPFNHCPNIRPAFELLNEMKFTNAKLLNLPKNLKVDWINKGYPMQN
ncbi:MAG: rhodanese-like domain-containing protein, partial [Taibaiella sp.]|nr:rhodanese-like domain-containing protein [Taibaiella sp.]